MRTTASILAMLATLASGAAFAQESAGDVDASHIAVYQMAMESGCKDAGHRSGDSDARVDAFCGCMVQVLKTELTPAEWQQAYRYSATHRNKEEMQVFGPHLQKIQSCEGRTL